MTEPKERPRNQPLTGTGPHKRANEDRLLREVYLSLRNVHTKCGALLDMFSTVLMDRENRDAEEAEDAQRDPIPRRETEANRAQTVMHKAVTSEDLIDRATTRWDEARTEDDRAKVVEMLERGRDQGLLTNDELESVLSRLRS